jgi:Outer membrane protein beta-barrel domain
MNSSSLTRMLICPAGFCFALSFGFARPALAQEEYHRFSASVGGGFTGITGSDAGKLDHGGNVQAGAGYFFNRYLGITGNFMFNGLGITRSELNRLNQPDGNARVYSVTADPTVRFPLGSRANVYFLVGGGYFRRTVEFTQPTLAQTVVFDPWWGYFGPALIQVNQVLGKFTSNSGAFDVGGGINIRPARSGPYLYVESRYMRGFTSNSDTSVVPLVVGVRW